MTGRPLSAAIFICSQRLPQVEETNAVSQLVDTVVHELLHGLFFELTHLRKVPGLLTSDQRAVASPKVRMAASTLFGCPFDNVASIPLDYAGPKGTQGNHWSALTLAGDIMTDHFTGVGHRQRSMSAVTLALAEDTGWYRRTNKSTAAFLRRGFQAGCGILQLVPSSDTALQMTCLPTRLRTITPLGAWECSMNIQGLACRNQNAKVNTLPLRCLILVMNTPVIWSSHKLHAQPLSLWQRAWPTTCSMNVVRYESLSSPTLSDYPSQCCPCDGSWVH